VAPHPHIPIHPHPHPTLQHAQASSCCCVDRSRSLARGPPQVLPTKTRDPSITHPPTHPHNRVRSIKAHNQPQTPQHTTSTGRSERLASSEQRERFRAGPRAAWDDGHVCRLLLFLLVARRRRQQWGRRWRRRGRGQEVWAHCQGGGHQRAAAGKTRHRPRRVNRRCGGPGFGLRAEGRRRSRATAAWAHRLWESVRPRWVRVGGCSLRCLPALSVLARARSSSTAFSLILSPLFSRHRDTVSSSSSSSSGRQDPVATASTVGKPQPRPSQSEVVRPLGAGGAVRRSEGQGEKVKDQDGEASERGETGAGWASSGLTAFV
jgi:hypothetical protein